VSYDATMLSRTLPTGFIEPCLPSPAEKPPSDPDWIHEIKHDGYVGARRWPTAESTFPVMPASRDCPTGSRRGVSSTCGL